ncbi:MAG: DUF3857 domain-containing protein [Bacteroidota bacterium]|nr:DUF3857 domain-containing protein [Bacteroidota bacterium]
MKLIIVALTLFFGTGLTNVNGQSKEDKKYREESEAMRREVWAWSKPQFNVKEIPPQYANTSKVIIAHHTEIAATHKNKFGFYNLTLGTKSEQTVVEVVRERVKLNDKKAVAEYSELRFIQSDNSDIAYNSDHIISYVGAKVLKANGSVSEINGDDIIITNQKAIEKTAQVAIPDLQPGDILDYFIATEVDMSNDAIAKNYDLLLFDEAPILSLSFHGQLKKKYAIEYRSYNGAPDLQVSKNDDNDIIADVQQTNIHPFQTALWVSPGMQFPFIRMNISLGEKGAYKYGTVRKPGTVLKNTDTDQILDETASTFGNNYFNYCKIPTSFSMFKSYAKDAKKMVKQGGRSFDDLSEEDKAAQLYYAFRFQKFLSFDVSNLSKMINRGQLRWDSKVVFPIFALLKAGDMEPSILISNSRFGFRMSEIMYPKDLTSITYLPAINKFVNLQSIYDVPFTAPEDIEGLKTTKNFMFEGPSSIKKENKTINYTTIAPGIVVPASASDKNAHIENLKLSLLPEKSLLSVHRSTTIKGHYKAEIQEKLILFEDFYESERKALNMPKSLIEQLEDGKRSKKYVDEVKNAFAEERNKQKDAFTKEASEWFEQEVTDLKDYKTDNLGVRHTSPDFIYSSSFNMGGLIKKAGNNLIVEVGKIQGQPILIKPEQRKRDIDIYMPFARSNEYNLELEVPDGFTSEGVAALNKKVENETGYFSVEASTSGKIITIKIKRHYLHNYEPANNWEKLLAFMDASNEWTNAKILFKKK